jgi:ketosteroid isomerase-like protein
MASAAAKRAKAEKSEAGDALHVHDNSADIDEIKALVDKYAKSIDDADTTLASQIWLDSPDVSFIHPAGHEHGFAQIKENVYKRLMGETFSERKLIPHDVSVHVFGDTAFAEFYWDFTAKLRKDGSQIATHGRETQVYRKGQEGWRLVHVHYSGMPVTTERQGP